MSLWASFQSVLLFSGILVAKYLAVCKTYEHESLFSSLRHLWLALPWDFLTVGLLLLAAMGFSFLPQTKRSIRCFLFVFLYALFTLSVSITFVNEEFYASFGSPLKFHLVALAPAVAGDLLRSGVSRNIAAVVGPLLTIAVSLAVIPYACGRVSQASFSRWRRGFCCASLLALMAGGYLFSSPPANMRASALRNLTLATVLKSEASGKPGELAPASPAEVKMLAGLCGNVNTEAVDAFALLPKKKYNVVVWVWESVGLRYLKSYHSLGVARTPNLDRIAAAGSVNFTDCHCESPLTVQTGWSLVSGKSPPARPIIFTNGKTLPEHPPYLPNLFTTSGYQTAHFNSSHLTVWNMQRFMRECGFQEFVDCDGVSAAEKKAYDQHDWGIEDRFLVDHFKQWVRGIPKSKPFFTVLWNIETHHPYVWHGMSPELEKASDLERYVHAIEYSDSLLGEVYDALAQRGLAEDTIFVVIGDHGEGLGRPPRPYERGHSMLVFEDSLHIPLLFINPAFKRMHTASAQCNPVDLYPTLLDLTQMAAQPGSDGHSLASPYPPRPFYCRSIVWWPVSVRAGAYKLILGSPEQLPELYNVESDPVEANDIASSQVDITNVLTAALLRMSADRYKNDPSFEFGFSLTQPASANPPSKRPPVSDLLK